MTTDMSGEKTNAEGVEAADELLTGDVTFIAQSYNDTGKLSRASYPDATYTTDFYIESVRGSRSRVFIHFESGAGNGLDGEELVLASGVNRDAGNSENRLEMTEAWYELILANGKTNITFGKLDPTYFLDQNRFANDETMQFISFAFRNNQAIEFPGNHIGIHLLLSPWPVLEVESEIVDTGPSMEEIFERSFASLQVNIKPFASGRANLRLYAWSNGSRHETIEGGKETGSRNAGYGTSIDLDISKETGMFFRYGRQNGDLEKIEQFASLGLNLEGDLWGRDKDLLGAAVALNSLSGVYRRLTGSSRKEVHIEAYYNWFALERLSISPDIQIIFNPYGFAAHRILVFSLRTQIYL